MSERSGVLRQVETWLELPMVLLGFVWLILLILELTRGLPASMQKLSTAIWIAFIADYCIKFLIAPRKLRFLRKNWLTAISLALPALRVFRIVRAFRLIRLARATRSIRLVKVVASLNRGMRALNATMQKRRVGYVLTLTFVVTLAGAAGMYAFERNPGGRGLNDYGTALWWTTMIMTTMGSEFWPLTPEGRILCVLLSLYAFGVFGYVTATLATFFVGRELQDTSVQSTGRDSLEKMIVELKQEVAALRLDIASPVKTVQLPNKEQTREPLT